MSDVNIICTMGPASAPIHILRQMAEAGMNIIRLNFSHGTHEDHAKMVGTIEALKKEGYDLKILLDLEGYQIRIGKMAQPLTLTEGQKVVLARHPEQFEASVAVPLEYESSFHDIVPGVNIYIDDGHILLKAVATGEAFVETRVLVPGTLKTNKGVNIPEIKLKFDVFTKKDKRDILFGVKHKVDYIAQSFVRNAADVLTVRSFLEENHYDCKVISKIENREGIDSIDEIMQVSDGIMIARGDMGVSIPIYQVPVIQKIITARCNKAGKMVITATQMLESMTVNIRPTRAEVTDVANAVLDGTNSVMLSGETAVGSHPIETVRMMKSIINYTNQERDLLKKTCRSQE